MRSIYKRLIFLIILLSTSTILLYILGSFISGNMDITLWSNDSRAIVSLFMGIAYIISAIFSLAVDIDYINELLDKS